MSALDSGIRLYRQADSNGKLVLPAGDYDLVLNHVSFKARSLRIRIPEHDTAIGVTLNPRIVSLDEVRIRSGRRLARKHIRTFGNAGRRSRSSWKIPMDVRIGMVFKPEPSGAARYLNSVRFRLKNISELRKSQDNLEIRVYKMQGSTISGEPANSRPIYLKLDKLRTVNDVRIDEMIKIPDDGIFISLELPAVSDDQQILSMTFVSTLYHDDCNLFYGKVSKTIWNAENFPQYKACDMISPALKYVQLSIGISYFE